MTLHKTKVTITSDASGDATVYAHFTGILEAITIVNDGTAIPTNSWDLAITENETGRAVWSSTTIANDAVAYAAPGIEAWNTNDGAAATDFFVKHPCNGLKMIGDHMGDKKIAYVYVYWTEGK